MKKWFSIIILMVGLLLIVTSLGHAAVEFVKVCNPYGKGFYYVPGTDICFNPMTSEIRQQTPVGTLVSFIPSTTGDWLKNPTCTQGRLVKVGTFTSSDFTLNSYMRFSTAPFPLTLSAGEFIAKVMMSGDLEGTSFLCLSFYDASLGDYGTYSTIGCLNPEVLMEQPATFSFTPLRTVPPSDFTKPFSLVGYNALSDDEPVNGALSCWVCIQSFYPRYPPYPQETQSPLWWWR